MTHTPTLAQLRALAVRRSLYHDADLISAIRRLGFVQADPIRAPARAQDLILRHRVPDYRAGDLEQLYPSLPVAEDMLHVYGFVPHETLALLHPRALTQRWRVEHEHPHLRHAILGHLRQHGMAHPRDLEGALGRVQVVNGWGGTSSATTRMLEALHYEGRLSVARRDAGIKVYGLAPRGAALKPVERARGLVRLIVGKYAPLPIASLKQLLRMIGERAPANIDPRDQIAPLIRRGELVSATVEGLEYVWSAADVFADDLHAPETLWLLAPFDPLVWDRRRFVHFWGWEYRFEAYTPAPKRRFGYYALPMLWRDQVIGWANVTAGVRRPKIELGFIGKRPRDVQFRAALDAEAERLRVFLTPRS